MPAPDYLWSDQDLPIEQLSEFLTHHRPKVPDILGAACELYHVDPGRLVEKCEYAKSAHEMFVFCAFKWGGVSLRDAAQVVGLTTNQAHRCINAFRARLWNGNSILHDDLDLIAIRLTEAVLRRKRHR